MSKNSEAVKRWRNATKERMVESLGGECAICGYSDCYEALEFHHLESDKKDFGFGNLRANIKGWKTIVEELRKCVLLCANCHREVHSSRSETVVPDDAPRFNEDYVDYKVLKRDLEPCPVCGKDKPTYNKTCSYECAAKTKGRVDWDNVDLIALFEKYKTQTAVADYLGISDGAVHKRMKKINAG